MTSTLQLNSAPSGIDDNPRGTRSAHNKDSAVAKTGLKAALALDKASEALNAHVRACLNAGLPYKGEDDGRTLLVGSMSEYATYLTAVYDKGNAA